MSTDTILDELDLQSGYTYRSLYMDRIPLTFTLNMHGHVQDIEPLKTSSWKRIVCIRRGRSNKLNKNKKPKHH